MVKNMTNKNMHNPLASAQDFIIYFTFNCDLIEINNISTKPTYI